jgi:ABC-2 type transport system ATP-binding protein
VVFHLASLDPAYPSLLRDFDFVRDVQSLDNSMIVSLSDPEQNNPLLVRALVNAGAEIQFVGELRHSLEDIYLQTIQSEQG